ncbi:hypothetical protein G6F51_014367 [Rhizopus arrhizus]|uniref:Uncharacterized protein n=1 Tax=Rhizopus oryzae TaxID=64495 RepID=A0A9P6XMB9_RHIOR|nr:hypothetical protein G6F51_014367 [Rhizopus arrhizus]
MPELIAAMVALPEEVLLLACAAPPAASMPSRIGIWSRWARATPRSTCCWVTWAISCDSTAATSSSRSAVNTRPALTPM